MAIDPVVAARQRAIFDGAPVVLPNLGGRTMTTRRCPRCRARYLAEKNTSGVCYVCWDNMSAKQRAVLRGETWRVRRATGPRRADKDTVERARARLIAKGIVIREAA